MLGSKTSEPPIMLFGCATMYNYTKMGCRLAIEIRRIVSVLLKIRYEESPRLLMCRGLLVRFRKPAELWCYRKFLLGSSEDFRHWQRVLPKASGGHRRSGRCRLPCRRRNWKG